jgi:aflatoxin B1 aldehyde reductase
LLQSPYGAIMKAPIPRLYLGTMTFAWSQTSSKVDHPVALEMVKKFISFNTERGEKLHRIDTARIYAGGSTEDMVGSVLAKLGLVDGIVAIGTKAHPSQKGGLSRNGIEDQFKASVIAMGAMKIDKVDEYYLHQPDTEYALLESLKCLHEMITNGAISAIGMSNYNVKEMERVFALVKKHDLTPPTVYQGLYNPLNRLVENELLPLLKANQCSFVAYNPLAAGLLAGKHTDPDQVQKGRFKDNQNYLPRFYTLANFDAIELIRQACEKESITMVEATYRWLLRHSALGLEDGVLLGASSLVQLDQNLKACSAAKERPPLPASVLQAFEKAWKLTENGAFPYWRSYSSDMPNRNSLDPGASYNATKK